jgi:uncharacterized iron-regulated membrane protein
MMATDFNDSEANPTNASRIAWLPTYLQIWRWHFYASLFCLPLVIMLSITGTIYLFKPQIEAWQTRNLDRLEVANGPVKPVADQVESALQSIKGSEFESVELSPSFGGNTFAATRIHLQQNDRKLVAFVHPVNNELISMAYDDEQWINVAKKLHGELMIGDIGSHIVETAASWTLVMVLTGLCLWWPRSWRIQGTLIPRFRLRSRLFFKDLHSVGGFWLSGSIVFLIVTGLPWAAFWGDYFKSIRFWTGQAVVKQDWTTSSGEHQHGGRSNTKTASIESRRLKPLSRDQYNLQEIEHAMAYAKSLNLQPPVLVTPSREGQNVWTIRSDTANRPHRMTVEFDIGKSSELKRSTFSDRHWIDQLVGNGIAIHEGQRFGWLNQLLALLTTVGLLMLSVTGAVMWWKRRDVGLSAPPRHVQLNGGSWLRRVILMMIVVGLSIAMPLFGLSLVVVLAIEKIVAMVRSFQVSLTTQSAEA